MISLKKYNFEGPYRSTSQLQDRQGIYAILNFSNSRYLVVDIGESRKVKTRIDYHDRQSCWTQNSNGTLCVAVMYTPNLNDNQRRLIEQELRGYYKPTCGDN
jgi:hypothetical protein